MGYGEREVGREGAYNTTKDTRVCLQGYWGLTYTTIYRKKDVTALVEPV